MQAIELTLHDNWHSTISSFLDVCYFVKIRANELAFEERLGRGLAKNLLSDLFPNGTTSPARGVSLADYKASLRGNWGSVYLDNNEKNDENEVDSNADTVEGREKNIENSNNVDF